MKLKLLATTCLMASSAVFSQVMTQQNILQGIMINDPSRLDLNTVILDRIMYNDNIYSTSRKTELGDQSELSMALRYHVSPTTFTRLRFVTSPVENRFNNKTSRFELIFAKSFENLQIQIDLDILTNDVEEDADSGGTSLGPDLDSDDTLITYNINNNNSLVFYPFNFRSDVGDEFNTLDVSRINSIAGSPSSISGTISGTEYIVSKTIPGLEYNYHNNGLTAYFGVGVASYFYPTNASFDIETNPSASAWERRETTAYKFGFLYLDGDKTKINFQYLAHNNTDETGALLQSAGSINVFKRFGKFIVELETTMTEAGKNPYNVDPNTRWFRNQTPFLATYSDRNGNRQNWFDHTGFGHSLKIGMNLGKITPFVSLKYQDEHFIFDGDESAHLLRTKDEDLSHGGLARFGVGAYLYKDNLFFRPMIEVQRAQNPVFTNSTDLRADRSVSSFKKQNIVASFNLTYTFDGFSNNQLWWF